MTKNGIDVSVHQGEIDWSRVKTDFCIIQAGYGRTSSQKDKYFERNYSGCKSHNIPCGAYWYSYAKTVEDATKEGFRLPTLSERTMVYPKSRGTDVFLQADEFNGMDDLAREYDKRVRWDFSGERKRLAKLTAKKILENMTEAMEEESAVSHVEYIN